MSLDTGTNEFTRPAGIQVEPSTTWLIYARTRVEDKNGPRNRDLHYISQAYGTAESAMATVARIENLTPGKFVAISRDMTQIITATIDHRVVMDV